MTTQNVPTTLEDFERKYKVELLLPGVRKQLINWVVSLWPNACLDASNENELRIADIYGNPSVKKHGKGGSLSLNIDVDSEVFFYLHDWDASQDIRSASIIDTILLIYLGSKGIKLEILQDKQQTRILLAQCAAKVEEIIQNCISKMDNNDNQGSLRCFKPKNISPKKFVNAYKYYTIDGKPFNTVTHFVQNGQKIYAGSGKHETWPLYNLQNIKTVPITAPVILGEGEKVVNLLQPLIENLVFVTTLRGGAGTELQPHHLELLKGRSVFIMRDADETGLEFATVNYEILSNAGITADIISDEKLVKLYQLKDGLLPSKYDSGDFVLANQDNHAALQKFVVDLSEIIGVPLNIEPISQLKPQWASEKAGLLRNASNEFRTEPEEDSEWLNDVLFRLKPKNKKQRKKKRATQRVNLSDELHKVPDDIQGLQDGEVVQIKVLPNEVCNAKYCQSINEATLALQQLKNGGDCLLGLDIETQKKRQVGYEVPYDKIGLHPCASEIRLIQIYSPNLNCAYVFDCDSSEVLLEVLKYITSQVPHLFVAHNAGFELLYLTAAAIEFKLLLPKPIHCTYIQHRLLYEGKQGLSVYMGSQASLESIVKQEFAVVLDKTYQNWKAWSGTSIDVSRLTYAALDAIFVAKLFGVQQERLLNFRTKLGLPPQLNPEIDEYLNNIDALPAVAQACAHGINISPTYYNDALKLAEQLKGSREHVLNVLNVNAADAKADLPTKAVAQYLETHLPHSALEKCARTESTNVVSLKTNNLKLMLELIKENEVLVAIEVKTAIETLLTYRKLKHEVSTQGLGYLAKHLVQDRIYPSFKILGAKTGRMSSIKPNLQNISVGKFSLNYRNFYIPSPGYHFVEFDFSMIEVVFFAYLSNNLNMIKVLESGADLHEYTSAVFQSIEVDPVTCVPRQKITKSARKRAKAASFGLLYGSTVQGLISFAKNSYDVDLTYAEAEFMVNKWKDTFNGVRQVHEQWSQFARINRMFETVSGLLKITPYHALDINVNEFLNFGIQGSAGTLLKFTIRLLLEHLEKFLNSGEVKFINFVHDSILLEVKNDTFVSGYVEDVIKTSCSTALRKVIPQVPRSLARRCFEISVGETPETPWGLLESRVDTLKTKYSSDNPTTEELEAFKVEREALYAKHDLNEASQPPVIINFNADTPYTPAPCIEIKPETPYNLVFLGARVYQTRQDKPYLRLLFRVVDGAMSAKCSMAVFELTDTINPCRSLLKALNVNYKETFTSIEAIAETLNSLSRTKLPTIKGFLEYRGGFLNATSFLDAETLQPIALDISIPESVTGNNNFALDRSLCEPGYYEGIVLAVEESYSKRLYAQLVVTVGVLHKNNKLCLVKCYLCKPRSLGGNESDAMISMAEFMMCCKSQADYQALENVIGSRILCQVERNFYNGHIRNQIENIYPIEAAQEVVNG